ncbi:MAG: DUF3370 domain-containing protein [Prochlorotrichaceae cyanobacterium]
MWFWLSVPLWFAQATVPPVPPTGSPAGSPATPPAPPPVEWVRPQEVRPLTGALNQVPVFNSNSPEIVLEDGILLSTFPPENKRDPKAHLNFAFEGRFDLFAHHIGRFETQESVRTLYLGLLVYNPAQGQNPRDTVTLNVLKNASYRSQPDAPFIPLPDWLEDPAGLFYSGPGSRAMSTILRESALNLPPLTLQPGEFQLLSMDPIVVKGEPARVNGRSLLMQLESSGKVYVASLAYFAKTDPTTGAEIPPILVDWVELLETADLVSPRDRTPTPIEQTQGQVIYGRVSGVSIGSEWHGVLTDPQRSTLNIPAPGQALSYPISSLLRGRLGTQQIQSAPLAVRYEDTAYQAHGNYGVGYRLVLPLQNQSDRPQSVAISLETPLKEDDLSQKGLRFFVSPPDRIFFRGPVRIRYRDRNDRLVSRYLHLVLRRGQRGTPLATIDLAPGEQQRVTVELLYPADSTPPQVLTLETLPRLEPPRLEPPEILPPSSEDSSTPQPPLKPLKKTD